MPKILVKNRRANYDYQILETFEAGLALKGYETKSIRTGNASLKGSYVTIKDEEAYLTGAHISPYQQANLPQDYEPTRSRKLLLHKKEIKSLLGKLKMKGLTLVPLRIYTKRGKIKLEFGLGRGKRKIDKREKIKKREVQRKIARVLREK